MCAKKQEPVPVIEVGFSILSTCLAIIMFGSDDLFNKLPKTYEFFKAFAPENVWGAIFLWAALTKLLGLATKKRSIRKVGLIASTVIYGLIASVYFLGAGWFSIGFFTFAVLSFMALFAVREVDWFDGK